MHPFVAALSLSALLVAAGGALSLVGTGGASADHGDGHHEARHSSGAGHNAGAHPYAGGEGTVPTLMDALTKLDRRSRIVIEGDAGFNPANGVRAGSGSFDDPFVISGWYVDVVYIHDTSAAFEIKDSYVSDIMILDWTGPGGYVHHNHISNLRTNRNVERVGDPSATVIEDNLIVRVEELRHFDGIVRNNTIGREPTLGLSLPLGPSVVLNIAGLNGAGIHDNLVWGGVDMKIHGHHHSDATGAHSHNHGQPDDVQGEDHVEAAARESEDQDARPQPRVENHQVRYVDFLFYNNTIRDTGFGLRYNDLAHAGDDRTATSEQEPALEMPHVHHTRVTLANNVIQGATLRVASLNAADERHLPGQTGELVLRGNRIVETAAGSGIVVHDVADARVLVEGNSVARGGNSLQLGQNGILLKRFANSTVHLRENDIGAYRYGIRASEFDANTTWSAEANDAPASEYPVYWDDSVPNPPAQAEGRAHDEGHEHGGDGAGADADPLIKVARRSEVPDLAPLINARP